MLIGYCLAIDDARSRTGTHMLTAAFVGVCERERETETERDRERQRERDREREGNTFFFF